MIGKLLDDKVVFEYNKKALLELAYYGRKKGNELLISLEEAAYLIKNKKISVKFKNNELDFEKFIKISSQISDNFELKYIVYKDLRERGYFVQPSVTDFRVYPRGGKPSGTPAKYFVHVISERKSIELEELLKAVLSSENVRKRMILSIVDEESDTTYYEVKSAKLNDKKKDFFKKKMNATLLHDRVIVWDSDFSLELNGRGFFGKYMDENRLQLSLVESAYLLKNGFIEISDANGKKIGFEEFIKLACLIEADFSMKYDVYEDIRDKGLIAKTGFKFGSHFRVYDDISEVKSHSKYLVHSISKEHSFSLPEISGAIRLAQTVRKRMLFAYKEGKKIKYIEIDRVKL